MSGISVSVDTTITVRIDNHDAEFPTEFVWTMEEARAIKDALVPIVGAGPPPPPMFRSSNVVPINRKECHCGSTCPPGHCYNVPA